MGRTIWQVTPRVLLWRLFPYARLGGDDIVFGFEVMGIIYLDPNARRELFSPAKQCDIIQFQSWTSCFLKRWPT